jgi:2'-5' RNA ligase
MKRLFIAVPVQIAAPFDALTQNLQKELSRDKIVWVEPELQHLTLRFLGKTPEHFIEPLIQRLREITTQQEPFTLELNKLGVFGTRYAPAVLWYGFQEFSKFKELFLNLEPSLIEIGFESNYGNFVPHLTVGRIRMIEDKKKFSALVAASQPTFSQSIPIEELHLIRSKLTPSGPKYTVLETFLLQKK